MGLGKSIQAIGVINEDPTIRKVIIVCPASMRTPWRREKILINISLRRYLAFPFGHFADFRPQNALPLSAAKFLGP